MTNAEYTALVTKLGEAGAIRCIEILDNYKGANGKKYESDYRAILNWVVKRYNEELQQPQPRRAAPGEPQLRPDPSRDRAVRAVNYANQLNNE